MKFTMQDLYTFLIGLGVSIAVPFAGALIQAEAIFEDPVTWAIALAVGVISAAGRYILTEITQRSLTGRN